MSTFLYVRLEIGDVDLTVEREQQLLHCVKTSSGLIDDALYLDISPMEKTFPDAFAALRRQAAPVVKG